MKFRIVTSVAIVFCMLMFFGMLVLSVDNIGDEELYKEMISHAKTAKLELNKHSEVNQLMNDYMRAKQTVNMKQLENCVNDISKYKQDELKRMQRLVKGVDNIKCYTIEGWEKDSYIVYLYFEYRVKNVRSKIPNLVRDIVCRDNNGRLCVFSGALKSSAVNYIESTKYNPEVVDMIKRLNANINKLRQKDSTVQNFYKALEMQEKNNKKNYNKAKDEKNISKKLIKKKQDNKKKKK